MKPDVAHQARVPLALRAHYVVDRLGPVGVTGAAAIVAAILLLGIAEGPWQRQLARDQGEVAALREQLQQARSSRAPAPPDGPPQFAAQLPAASTVPELVEALHEDAATRNLRIERGDYRVAPEMGGLAQRHQVTLPVRGDYARLQGWLQQALLRHPALALDELSVRRSADDQALVEARVQFSLYTRSAP